MSMSQMDADIKANWSQQTKAHPKFEFAVITFWYNQLLFHFYAMYGVVLVVIILLKLHLPGK